MKLDGIEENAEDVQNLLSHLEEEYQNGKISDKTYKELKSNYQRKLAKQSEQPQKTLPVAKPIPAAAAMKPQLTANVQEMKSKILLKGRPAAKKAAEQQAPEQRIQDA